jgi:serine/threonine protein kinase
MVLAFQSLASRMTVMDIKGLPERFELRRILGRGSMGAVYVAFDRGRNRECALKIVPKFGSRTITEYSRHLQNLSEVLSGKRVPGILAPYNTGQTDEYLYIAFDLVTDKRVIADVLNERNLQASQSLWIISQLAAILARLHSRGIIHADVKPSNVWISSHPKPEVLLGDFGMARKYENDALLLVGTFHYMPPALRSGQLPRRGESTQSTELPIDGEDKGREVGPVIDLYALGTLAAVILYGEVLDPYSVERKGQVSADAPINRLSPTLQTEVRAMIDRLRDSEAETLPTARTIAQEARELYARVSVAEAAAPQPTGMARPEQTETAVMVIATVQHQLKALTRSLYEMRQPFHSVYGLRLAWEESPPDIIDDVRSMFANSSARIRNSWRFSIAIASIYFLVIVAMAIAAVTLGIVTGKSTWPILLGGVSTTMLFGTLFWKPFDRIFRATIIANQLEVIHIQTVVALKSTEDFEKRLSIFREATSTLGALFDRHDKPDPVAKRQLGEDSENPPV